MPLICLQNALRCILLQSSFAALSKRVQEGRPMSFSIQGIFEVHLPVSNRAAAAEFYQRVLGFELATEIPNRDITFLWIGGRGKGMLGLWGPECPNPPITRGQAHFAFQVSLEELEKSPLVFEQKGVTPLDFDGEHTDEPVVLAWMPAASVYFKDLDGHSIELITMLDEEPRKELGVLSLSRWRAKTRS
jgi:lactoylglutathione lyase